MDRADVQRSVGPTLKGGKSYPFSRVIMTSRIYPPELRLRGQEPYGRMGCCGVTDKESRRLKELKFTFTFFFSHPHCQGNDSAPLVDSQSYSMVPNIG